ncbi:hypothetical protein, partial [Asticcacaulis sp.]|uniref:hypothetical protein n=1 Tax=Asticcacaulis sp. TaxID=1872648 RepID=UPI0026240437
GVVTTGSDNVRACERCAVTVPAVKATATQAPQPKACPKNPRRSQPQADIVHPSAVGHLASPLDPVLTMRASPADAKQSVSVLSKSLIFLFVKK